MRAVDGPAHRALAWPRGVDTRDFVGDRPLCRRLVAIHDRRVIAVGLYPRRAPRRRAPLWPVRPLHLDRRVVEADGRIYGRLDVRRFRHGGAVTVRVVVVAVVFEADEAEIGGL